jgi:hypothetical protein
MTAFVRTHSTPILVVLLIALLSLAWLFPSSGVRLGIAFLLVCLLVASTAALEKHEQAYRQGGLTRIQFIRSASLEILGLLIVMVLAAGIGRYAAGAVSQAIENDLLRTLTGIGVALAVGFGVGALARGTWGRLLRLPL